MKNQFDFRSYFEMDAPPKVQRWFNISIVLNGLMFVAFIFVFLRNYLTSNLVIDDEPLPFFVFFIPFIFWNRYANLKQRFESQVAFQGYDFDLLVIGLFKAFLALAFVRLIVEMPGFHFWNWLFEQFLLPLLRR